MDGWARRVTAQIGQTVAGQEKTALWCLAAILARGHILLEDIPGVGKTSLAVALAQTMGLSLGRVQFTPDVMPADVVGYCVPKGDELVYQPGPIQCNLFLADELNRTPSRTQAALLEAMEENQVTVDGVCHRLPQPFVVIATQNPLGAAGTQPLPDSQLDRFILRLRLGYPDPEEEKRMLFLSPASPSPVSTAQELLELRDVAADTYIKDSVADYAVRLVAATRKTPFLARGGSPRATASVVALSKAWARLQGRDFVIPEDVRSAFLKALPHRVLGQKPDACLGAIVRWVRPPKMK